MSSEAFSLLHEGIRHCIYNQGWEKLKYFQEDAILKILETDDNIFIGAHTGSGKTEAALLPAVSLCMDNIYNYVPILYISPLRALINDQFERLNNFFDEIGIKTHGWHGEFSQSSKNKLLEGKTGGIIVITPESLESLLFRKPHILAKMLVKLQFIIIDELHSMIGTARGAQLHSQIARIEMLLGRPIRKIGLSATLNNEYIVKDYFNKEPTIFIKDISLKRKQGRFILYSGKDSTSKYNIILERTHNQKTLFFINSRGMIEDLANDLDEYVIDKQIATRYLVHHALISKEAREENEAILKKENNICVLCTSTLELGIDVGNINQVMFFDLPFDVDKFIQRIGRSGRKDTESSKFISLIECLSIENNENRDLNNDPQGLPDIFHDGVIFLSSLAIIYLATKKADRIEKFDYAYQSPSIYAHQILSSVYSKGLMKSVNLLEHMDKCFPNFISKETFKEIIGFMIERKFLKQDIEGISLGDAGLDLVKKQDFLVAFESSIVYKVHDIKTKKLIGGVESMPEIDDVISLNKKNWQVVEINNNNIFVKQTFIKGGLPLVAKSIKESDEIYATMQSILDVSIDISPLLVLFNTNNLPFVNDALENVRSFYANHYNNLYSKFILHFQRLSISFLLTSILDYLSIKFILSSYGMHELWLCKLEISAREALNEINAFISQRSDKEIFKAIIDNQKPKCQENIATIEIEKKLRLYLSYEKYDYLLPIKILESRLYTRLDFNGFRSFIKNYLDHS